MIGADEFRRSAHPTLLGILMMPFRGSPALNSPPLRGTTAFRTATLALIAVLGLSGSAFAGATLAANSVGAAQIKKNAVRASEIKNNAIRASEIKNNAVGADEVKDGAVGSEEVTDGSLLGQDLAPGVIAGGIEGTPLGGDLAGAFPNPRLKPEVLTGLMRGTRATSNIKVSFGQDFVTLVTLPKVQISASCFSGGTGDRVLFRIRNTGAENLMFVSQTFPAVGAPDTNALPLQSGEIVTFGSDPSVGENQPYVLDLRAVTTSDLEIELTGVSNVDNDANNQRGRCFADAVVTTS